MYVEQRTSEEQAGLYIISVAARLLSMHPQTLRKYERAGFLSPSRTVGMLRLYSAEDLALLQLIKHFVEDMNLNLAGVEMGLELAKILGKLQYDLETTGDPEQLRAKMQKGLQQAAKTLKLDEVQPPTAPQATITIEF